MAAKLVVQDLQKRFGDQEVLRGASFTFEQGKIYGLIGRNGAGKTTFFNCLNEDLPRDGGSFHLVDDGGNPRPVTADDMGYVLSTPVVPEFLTAREFLQFFLEINRDRIPYPKAPDVYLDYMCIDEADRGKLLKDFSHGMKNKMQMLVNIMADPTVLLLDEPLTSFDVVVADEMQALLRRIKVSTSSCCPPTSWTWPWTCATTSSSCTMGSCRRYGGRTWPTRHIRTASSPP